MNDDEKWAFWLDDRTNGEFSKRAPIQAELGNQLFLNKTSLDDPFAQYLQNFSVPLDIPDEISFQSSEIFEKCLKIDCSYLPSYYNYQDVPENLIRGFNIVDISSYFSDNSLDRSGAKTAQFDVYAQDNHEAEYISKEATPIIASSSNHDNNKTGVAKPLILMDKRKNVDAAVDVDKYALKYGNTDTSMQKNSSFMSAKSQFVKEVSEFEC